MSLWGADADGLTVEFKINFLAPANGERLIARARVARPGRTISVCAADVFATSGDREKLVGTMLATLMRVEGQRPAQTRASEEQVQRAPARDVTEQRGHARRAWCPCGWRAVRGAIRELIGRGH